MLLIVILILSYLAGSVNFSILLFKILGLDDPRRGYSGNAGTTNVYRMAGPVWAVIVLLLDVGRAVAVSLIARYALEPGSVTWAGLALIAGNGFPCFHGFKGGKGVANYLGFSAAITPAGAIVACIAWVVVYLLKKIPFIASFAMIAVLGVAVSVSLDNQPGAILGTLATLLLIIFNHRDNISGLMSGTPERKNTDTPGDDETD